MRGELRSCIYQKSKKPLTTPLIAKACIRAKSTKTPYYLDEYTANEKIAYIHSDTCGPFPASFSKSIHYITFTCDYTRYVWVYLIQNKRTIKSIFAKRKAEETGCKVKTIRTDGGGEYEREMTSYFESRAIKHLLAAPYSPQLNGTAERLNRTLNDANYPAEWEHAGRAADGRMFLT